MATSPLATPAAAGGTAFQTGVIWNLGSLAFLALAGFALNVVIGRSYGPADLGIFNICFAFFIVFSQLGTFGIHLSVLQAVSEFWDRDPAKAALAIRQGFLACAAIAAVVTLIAFAASPLIARVYDAPGLERAWIILLPGLFFFCLNKFLLNVINGANHMRAFATLQALRYALILLALAAALLLRWPGTALTAVLTISEVALFPLTAGYVWRLLAGIGAAGEGHPFVGRHLWFGARVFLSGAVIELNSRIDVLMIGAMLDEKMAGIYTIAALVAEGLAQAAFAVRNSVNPLITRLVVAGNHDELLRLSRKIVLVFTPFMAAASLFGLLIFPWFARIAFGGQEFDAAYGPLMWLLLGLTLSAGMMTFGMLLSQTGHPGWHSAFLATVLLVNVALNALLIPLWGITGAGMAQAGANIALAVLIVVLARRVAGVRLLV